MNFLLSKSFLTPTGVEHSKIYETCDFYCGVKGCSNIDFGMGDPLAKLHGVITQYAVIGKLNFRCNY